MESRLHDANFYNCTVQSIASLASNLGGNYVAWLAKPFFCGLLPFALSLIRHLTGGIFHCLHLCQYITCKADCPLPLQSPPAPPPLFWQLIFVFQIFFYSRYCLAQYCQCTLIFFWFSLTKFVGAAVFSGPSTTPYLYPVLLTTDPNHQALHKQFGDASEPSLFVALCSNCVCALLEELAEFAAHPLPLAPAAGCFTPFCIGY